MLNVRYNPQDILKSSKIQTCSIPGSRCKAHILYIYQWLHICVDIYLKTSVFSVLKDIKCDFNALILNFYTPPPPPPLFLWFYWKCQGYILLFLFCLPSSSDMSYIPSEMPSEMHKIDLSRNGIKHLRPKQFLLSKDLKTLNLSSNNLQQIDTGNHPAIHPQPIMWCLVYWK